MKFSTKLRRAPPGGRRTVALDITPALLAICEINMNFLVETGEFEIAAGHPLRGRNLHKIVLTTQ